jgi:hypothetical protein
MNIFGVPKYTVNNPECLCSTMLNSMDNTLAFSVSYMLNAFKLYATKNLMVTAYLSMN